MLDHIRVPLTSATHGSESWHCPSPDSNTSCQAGASVPEREDRISLPRVQPKVSANCFLLRPCRKGLGGFWLGRTTHRAFPRTRQRFRVGRWTWQGVPLQLPPGQERLCAHGEPGALIASYPHFSSYLPSGLGEGPWGILGRELASLPKLVHLPLYSINGPWGRFPKGSPDGHGCWSMWRKAQSFTHLARWAALMGRPWPEAELQNPMVPGF